MTRKQAVTKSPTALANIVAGTTYSLQNRGTVEIFVSLQSAAPEVGDAAFIIPPLGLHHFAPLAGESVYVWHSADRLEPNAIYEEAS